MDHVQSDPVRVLTIGSDPIRCGPIQVLLLPEIFQGMDTVVLKLFYTVTAISTDVYSQKMTKNVD